MSRRWASFFWRGGEFLYRERVFAVLLRDGYWLLEAGGEAVDAAGVLLHAVLFESSFAFDGSPAEELIAFANIFVERHVHPA